MSLKIRECCYEDYEAVAYLVMQVHRLHLKNRPDVYCHVEEPMEKERFKAVIDGEDKLFVAEWDGKIAAYAIVRMMETLSLSMIKHKKYAYIDDFCVDANMKRKGIGKSLFEHIMEYAKTQKAESIQLSVWEFNKDALGFYEALGMKTRNRRMELDIL